MTDDCRSAAARYGTGTSLAGHRPRGRNGAPASEGRQPGCRGPRRYVKETQSCEQPELDAAQRSGARGERHVPHGSTYGSTAARAATRSGGPGDAQDRGALDALGRDAANRARGLAAETRSRMRADSSNARKLQERVRAELGRVLSHPQAIDVYVSADGCVCLTGPVLMEEADSAISAIQSVKGVQEVDDRLERYATTEHAPSLQADLTPPGRRSALMPELMVADDESAGLPWQHGAGCRAWLRSDVRKRTDSRSGVGERQLSHSANFVNSKSQTPESKQPICLRSL